MTNGKVIHSTCTQDIKNNIMVREWPNLKADTKNTHQDLDFLNITKNEINNYTYNIPYWKDIM